MSSTVVLTRSCPHQSTFRKCQKLFRHLPIVISVILVCTQSHAETGPPVPSAMEGFIDILIWIIQRIILPIVLLRATVNAATALTSRYMMKSTVESSPVSSLVVNTVPISPPACPLSILDSESMDGVLLLGEAGNRYRYIQREKRKVIATLAWSLALFSIASLVVAIILMAESQPSQLFGMIPIPIIYFIAVLVLTSSIIGAMQFLDWPSHPMVVIGIMIIMLIPIIVVLYAGGGYAALVGLWLFWALLTWYQLFLRDRKDKARYGKQDLLVLRVFGADANAASTFGSIARLWSSLGAVVTIADPSYVRYEYTGANRGEFRKNIFAGLLASLAVAISPSLDTGISFLFGIPPIGEQMISLLALCIASTILFAFSVLPILISAQRNFVRSRSMLLEKVAYTMGKRQNWWGSYGIRPFYCFDNLWRPAVQEMMENAEAILMDFRGFNPTKQGCAYEIGKALDTVPVHKIVLLLDDKTDKESMLQLFRLKWRSISTESINRSILDPKLKVYTAHHFYDWRDGILQWILSLLKRNKQWREDSDRILALLATAPEHQGVASL